ncbi:MAG TPA: hypothetical protein DEP82_04755 [Arthrobacter bacterium]|jgi:hypothetical protein|nr:hypothetical protein [Arthrobacter sp.]HCB57249.1 hypothetical protein [Arthrobacter sp.]
MTATKRDRPEPVLPARRLLRAHAFDPMSTRLSGRFLTIDIAFETDLRPGPSGRLLKVVDYDVARDLWYLPVDLNDAAILAQRGMRPVESDPRTHQQVVYAVAMSVIERFERFGGFRFRWRGDDKLRIVPHAFEGRNAYFDKDRRAVLFGYFRADSRDPGPNLPGQMMFTCLSVDVIAHEVTHAIVHRMRPYFSEPTHPDVLAWHEAIADLVALFNHFSFPEVVSDAVATSQGTLEEGSALLDLAIEFGQSTGRGAALRSAIGSPRTPGAFLKAVEPHDRGSCFVAAVFDAFIDSYKSQIADLRRIASAGTGVLPPGALPTDLVKRVTAAAATNADRFLEMVVRAFEYLPVVDVNFGDVVRAIVTADHGLYPDDAGQLRAILVEAFRRRGIYPPGVTSLADEALLWPKPPHALSLSGGTDGIDLASLFLAATLELDPGSTVPFAGDPATIPPSRDATPALAVPGRTARAHLNSHPNGRRLREIIHGWGEEHAYELGLDKAAGMIEVVSSQAAYLRGSDGQPRPIVVIQFAQRRDDLEDQRTDETGAQIPRSQRAAIRAGTTVIARVDGRVEFLVTKPLPLSDRTKLEDLSGDLKECALEFDKAGTERLRSIRDWMGDVEDMDALSAWTVEPATLRLSFARLHASQDGP